MIEGPHFFFKKAKYVKGASEREKLFSLNNVNKVRFVQTRGKF